jgi:hypothetical protein
LFPHSMEKCAGICLDRQFFEQGTVMDRSAHSFFGRFLFYK